MTIDQLNALGKEAFVQRVGWVFEDSPWVAERAWLHRPFSSLADVHAKMTSEVTHASRDQQLALLRAHPDLGARAAMSASSANEQAGAGLDQLTAQEFERLHQWNNAYKQKFGFPFLFAVKGSDKFQIFAAFEHRLNCDPEDEFLEALRHVYRIARFRLQTIIDNQPEERL